MGPILGPGGVNEPSYRVPSTLFVKVKSGGQPGPGTLAVVTVPGLSPGSHARSLIDLAGEIRGLLARAEDVRPVPQDLVGLGNCELIV